MVYAKGMDETTTLPEGITAEAYPGGIQYRCSGCGCHVTRTHVPGSTDCVESRRERDWSRSDR